MSGVKSRMFMLQVDFGEPMVMWLAGLHIPSTYITALVQIACRSQGWALDQSTFYTEATNVTNAAELTEKLRWGCYVSGLYLEGAGWDLNKGCLRIAHPGELIHELPILMIIPAEISQLKLTNTIRTPIYVTSDRRNAMGIGFVFEANLYTTIHSSIWILQGLCILLNTD
ncbi:DNAH10 [Cordylochernes scorpioides]|uniref:DNAH10 n=1 Tax=Cordylochernes scorpioides TaxID=51811 RepID=A0ABY6KEB0_9ARAC|nr:DNAH10 [Cordylochernes scorpioides]